MWDKHCFWSGTSAAHKNLVSAPRCKDIAPANWNGRNRLHQNLVYLTTFHLTGSHLREGFRENENLKFASFLCLSYHECCCWHTPSAATFSPDNWCGWPGGCLKCWPAWGCPTSRTRSTRAGSPWCAPSPTVGGGELSVDNYIRGQGGEFQSR